MLTIFFFFFFFFLIEWSQNIIIDHTFTNYLSVNKDEYSHYVSVNKFEYSSLYVCVIKLNIVTTFSVNKVGYIHYTLV